MVTRNRPTWVFASVAAAVVALAVVLGGMVATHGVLNTLAVTWAALTWPGTGDR